MRARAAGRRPTAPAAQAQAPAEPTSWLCLPGQQPNPCAGDQTTTVFAPDGSSKTTTPKTPHDPKVDCFYVYPTVSDQPAQNANKNPDPPIGGIATYQAQRFSQICNVYAPLYRQRTVLGIFNPTTNSAEAGAIAYGDVLQAWRDYLANHNKGRGVVLIGHSQGTFHLRKLIAEEIEPKPAESAKLISGLLLGGNVLVKKGSTTGGDFQRTPACTGSTQVGCVVAYSTFNRTPPDNTRFGKYTPPAGQPDDKEVLCTNPAALSGGSAPVTTELPSAALPDRPDRAEPGAVLRPPGPAHGADPVAPAARALLRAVRARAGHEHPAPEQHGRRAPAEPLAGRDLGPAHRRREPGHGQPGRAGPRPVARLPGGAGAHEAARVPDQGRRGQADQPRQGEGGRHPHRRQADADRPPRDRPRRRRPLLRDGGRQPDAVLPDPPQRREDPPPAGQPHADGAGHQQALQRPRRQGGHGDADADPPDPQWDHAQGRRQPLVRGPGPQRRAGVPARARTARSGPSAWPPARSPGRPPEARALLATWR